MSKQNILTISIVLLMIVVGVLYLQLSPKTSTRSGDINHNSGLNFESEGSSENQKSQETMNLVIYVTNPEGTLEPVTIQTTETTGVANASLEYLFNNNLSVYGDYNDVSISNGIAYVSLEGNIPGGRTFSSLSSAEISDLTQSINATLTQYSTISDIELVDKNGDSIEF